MAIPCSNVFPSPVLSRTPYHHTQVDKSLPNNMKAVRDRISRSIEKLVASMTAREPYPELDDLCSYVQWVKDYAAYEKENSEFKERVQAENRADLQVAMTEFRRKHAWTIEQIVWDWCPFWQILMDNPDVLRELPSLPWTHDREFSTSLALLASVCHFICSLMSFNVGDASRDIHTIVFRSARVSSSAGTAFAEASRSNGACIPCLRLEDIFLV